MQLALTGKLQSLEQYPQGLNRRALAHSDFFEGCLCRLAKKNWMDFEGVQVIFFALRACNNYKNKMISSYNFNTKHRCDKQKYCGCKDPASQKVPLRGNSSAQAVRFKLMRRSCVHCNYFFTGLFVFHRMKDHDGLLHRGFNVWLSQTQSGFTRACTTFPRVNQYVQVYLTRSDYRVTASLAKTQEENMYSAGQKCVTLPSFRWDRRNAL